MRSRLAQQWATFRWAASARGADPGEGRAVVAGVRLCRYDRQGHDGFGEGVSERARGGWTLTIPQLPLGGFERIAAACVGWTLTIPQLPLGGIAKREVIFLCPLSVGFCAGRV